MSLREFFNDPKYGDSFYESPYFNDKNKTDINGNKQGYWEHYTKSFDFNTGEIKHIKSYCGYYVNNEKHGAWYSYFESGGIKQLSFYIKGTKEGIIITYFIEGYVSRTNVYKNGIADGIYLHYRRSDRSLVIMSDVKEHNNVGFRCSLINSKLKMEYYL